MNKICLITHVADSDGAFPIILSRLVFDNIDTFSCEVKEVDDTLTKVLESKIEYTSIYIVDLNITEEMAIKIDKDDNLKQKIKIFDHHASSEYLNKYSFEKVVVEENGKKECGTTIFYKHLKDLTNNPILEKESLKVMIELVREDDTYDYLEENKDSSKSLKKIYDLYGRERYIEYYLDFIKKNDTFYFTDTEKILIEIEEERINRYVLEKLEHVKFASIDGINVGITFAEKNRSIIGHEMANRFRDKIDIAIIIDVDRSVSYRADKDEVDINVLALKYNGGGHKHAGGSPLPIDLQEKITEYIFKNVDWMDDTCK